VPYTLLLADDSATIQRVIELTFADEDVTVVAVSDGDQAIAHLVAAPPDIVLADVDMPGKNGYDVALYIQRSPRLCHIPVVLLTGAFEPVDQALADGAGCEGVLAKPFEPQHVIGRVKELLARRRPGLDDVAPAPDVAAVENGELSTRSPAPSPTPITPSTESIWRWPLSDDETAAPFVDSSDAAETTEAGSRTERDDYFDQLDAAFSMLPSNPPGEAAPPLAAHADPLPPGDMDWFDTKVAEIVAAEPWDEMSVASEHHHDAGFPLAYEAPAPESSLDSPPEPAVPFAPPEIEAAANAEPVAAPDERLAPIEESLPIEPDDVPVAAGAAPQAAESPRPKRAPLPALADAFAALLAAEQGEPSSARSGLWPSALAPSAEAREELVEEVVRRVLDRLSDTVVREAVADIASKVAERLILEEIERIKASIK
jgi:CheY-like chemotaxis protein